MTTLAFSGHTIFCTDVPASARFYEKVLGFTRESTDAGDISLRAPVAGVATATVTLLLHHSDQPGPVQLGSFETDDVDMLVEKVRAAGCAVGLEPADAPWGIREASVSDPDGNELYITGPVLNSTARG